MKILRFDHITYVENRDSKQKCLDFFCKNEKWEWFELEREILKIKNPFLKYSQSTHDLYYFNSKPFPIETIFYDNVTDEQSMVEINDEKIKIISSDMLASQYCMDFLSAKLVTKTSYCCEYNLRGILDKTDKILRIEKKDRMPNNLYLDTKGYGCITLYVNSFNNIHDGLTFERGWQITMPQKFVVNNKELEIVFVKFKNINCFFELISLKRG